MTEENTNQENEALVLDLEDIINSARILKLKTADGVKELKIYNLTTLTSLEAESKARDNLVLLKRADSIREELKEAKGKSKKELLEEQAENLGKLESGFAEQIHTILIQDNPEVTKEEITRWGIAKCLEFINWFNNPTNFLAEAQEQEESTKKEAKESPAISE